MEEVIIVGAGIGGLYCGAKLAKKGKRVLILEKNPHMGGTSYIFKRNGYFFPMVWRNKDFPPCASIQEAAWKLEEIEQELRAQIETAKRLIPQVSHLSSHMGFTGLDSAIQAIYSRLEREYGMQIEHPIARKRFNGFGQARTLEEKITNFVNALDNLKPGVYIHVEHPGMDTPEMRAIGHKGYTTVAEERDAVTKVFTSERVMETVRKKGIRLIGYNGLRNIH